jgi:hypothetical protein
MDAPFEAAGLEAFWGPTPGPMEDDTGVIGRNAIVVTDYQPEFGSGTPDASTRTPEHAGTCRLSHGFSAMMQNHPRDHR